MLTQVMDITGSEHNPKGRWIGKAGGAVPNPTHLRCIGEHVQSKGRFISFPQGRLLPPYGLPWIYSAGAELRKTHGTLDGALDAA